MEPKEPKSKKPESIDSKKVKRVQLHQGVMVGPKCHTSISEGDKYEMTLRESCGVLVKAPSGTYLIPYTMIHSVMFE